jgi:hypothetical protein
MDAANCCIFLYFCGKYLKKGGDVLTPKQEKFCLTYLETGNASEAYRQVYNTSKMKKTTIGRKAFELLENGKITAKINELKAPAIKNVELTVENHLNRLAELRDHAFEAGNYAAAIRAEELRGKVAGFYTDRLELNSPIRMVVIDD